MNDPEDVEWIPRKTLYHDMWRLHLAARLLKQDVRIAVTRLLTRLTRTRR